MAKESETRARSNNSGCLEAPASVLFTDSVTPMIVDVSGRRPIFILQDAAAGAMGVLFHQRPQAVALSHRANPVCGFSW